WNVLRSISIGQPRFEALIADTANTGTLYARQSGALLKSTDGGISWRTANSGIRAVPFSTLAVDSQASGAIYADNYKSDDGAMSWRRTSSGFGPVTALAIDPQTPGAVYAGIGDEECGAFSRVGIFKTVDGGASWFDTKAGFGCLSAIVIDPQN